MISEIDNMDDTADFLFYTGSDGALRVEVIKGDETVWLNQKGIAEIFNVQTNTVTYHIGEIYKTGELHENGTTRKIRVVQTEGRREVTREIDFYNLDMIISIGYRVNSYQATQFRIWATNILKEYLIKGFALDDERLKQGKTLFGKDYFNELLERIREIRASERRFYQKITDLYAQASIDYDPNSPITKLFYATVQNKLEYAITHKTAAEIIRTRADALKPHMGLTTWKNAGIGGKILKTDVTVAKNYLSNDEISELNRLVTMYLDYAELQAGRQKAMKMQDWVEKLHAFLKFNEYDILNDAGKIRKDVADAFATGQYLQFRPIQDKEYLSDFDKVVKGIKETGHLPIEQKKDIPKQDLNDFDRGLKGMLEVPKPPKDIPTDPDAESKKKGSGRPPKDKK
ncbi:MAG: hypothetical protein JWO03_1500 [Bacteroidetes bacterium]|nr:hypothetical protein [Bacteroidota bacterium]